MGRLEGSRATPARRINLPPDNGLVKASLSAQTAAPGNTRGHGIGREADRGLASAIRRSDVIKDPDWSAIDEGTRAADQVGRDATQPAPEAAARKLIEIANSVEAVHDGRIHVEKINWPLLHKLRARRMQGRPGSRIARGWPALHESEAYVKFKQAGRDCRSGWRGGRQ
jgi:hypothetical protein